MVQTYPNLATSFTVGESYEQRPLKGLKISSSKTAVKLDGTPVNAKKAVWWDGGIHAREWISPATNIYIAHTFLSNYSHDATITHLIDQFDYYILPVFNVDGYAYTWTNDRLWRKTRSKTSNPQCFGADPNRNWDYQWCEGGATHDPCDEIYCGSKPFSEIETTQVAKFIGDHNDTIVHYINFHSYSQLWMTPWGYTTQRPQKFKLQDDGSALAVEALRAVSGTRYVHGNIGATIYVASGNTVDWTFGKAGVTFSYAVELRDTGEYGFLLPENQIIPTGKETLAGELALLKYIEAQVYA
jgi:murein tripeptide amidase MpaA